MDRRLFTARATSSKREGHSSHDDHRPLPPRPKSHYGTSDRKYAEYTVYERTRPYLERSDVFGQAMRNVHENRSLQSGFSSDHGRYGRDYWAEKGTDSFSEIEESCAQRGQTMKQMQLLRSKEASKQMLYGVFSNNMAMLEQFEARESPRKHLLKSSLYIPDQRGKTNEDIRSILETQLLLFETQTKSCPAHVKAEVATELRGKVLEWMGVRADHDCEIADTDRFAAQMYEILATGRTSHAFHSRPRRPHSAATIRESMPHILGGLHSARQLDEDFRKYENKKAKSPETRRCGSRNAISAGAKRIARCKPALQSCLEEDVQLFDSDCDDLK